MTLGLGLIILGFFGGVTYALTRKPSPTSGNWNWNYESPRDRVEYMRTKLEHMTGRPWDIHDVVAGNDKTSLYRVRVFVDPRYQRIVKDLKRSGSSQSFLTSVLKEKLLKLGFSSVLLATNDPTNTDLWTFLARAPNSPLRKEPDEKTPFRVLSIEPVLEPVIPAKEKHSTVLDNGLSVAEVEAVTHALAYDDDEKHLGGFASTLDPEYPMAAALLYAKAKLAAARSYGLGTGPEKTSDPLSIVDAACSKNVLEALRSHSAPLGQEVVLMWSRYEPVIFAMSAKHCAMFMDRLRSLKSQDAPKPIPASAIQLAYASKRPELSRVEDRKKIGRKLHVISKAADAGVELAQTAQGSVTRAEKLLERRGWIDWYRRIENVKMSEKGPPPGSLTRRSGHI